MYQVGGTTGTVSCLTVLTSSYYTVGHKLVKVGETKVVNMLHIT